MFSSGMPTTPYLYANDLIDMLKKKHAAGTYKSLVRFVPVSGVLGLVQGELLWLSNFFKIFPS